MLRDLIRHHRPLWLIVAVSTLAGPRAARANEIWVSPTYQQDIGGLGVASAGFWPVTPIGAVRLAWSIPDDLQALQGAKIVIIPASPDGAATLNVFVCQGQNGGLVSTGCASLSTQTFAGGANQLVEVEIGPMLAPAMAVPGAKYLAILAFTTPATTTDHIVGLRFSYAPKTPTGVATLGANTFGGVQTAPAFVGSFAGNGSALTNLPVPAGVATLGANIFTGTQIAPAFAGDGTALTNVAKLGANTFTATQSISTGDLDLGSRGRITKAGTVLMQSGGMFPSGASNFFAGPGAGNMSSQSGDNTGMGNNTLSQLSDGGANTAVGSNALAHVTSGSFNIAVGLNALTLNAGNSNTAIGVNALGTLAGSSAGNYDGNIAIGSSAGNALTLGSNNVYLANPGASSESGTIRIGGGNQTRTFIQAIRGKTTGNADAIPVVIDSNGQLGTVSSSRRFKENIHEMADASRRLFDLRPVTFQYTRAFTDGSKPIQFGLIAEEVAEVFPELAVRDADGHVETVHYEVLGVLLLNEVQRQEQRIADQQQRIEMLEREIAALMNQR
jgi:hypothetical protein